MEARSSMNAKTTRWKLDRKRMCTGPQNVTPETTDYSKKETTLMEKSSTHQGWGFLMWCCGGGIILKFAWSESKDEETTEQINKTSLEASTLQTPHCSKKTQVKEPSKWQETKGTWHAIFNQLLHKKIVKDTFGGQLEKLDMDCSTSLSPYTQFQGCNNDSEDM